MHTLAIAVSRIVQGLGNRKLIITRTSHCYNMCYSSADKALESKDVTSTASGAPPLDQQQTASLCTSDRACFLNKTDIINNNAGCNSIYTAQTYYYPLKPSGFRDSACIWCKVLTSNLDHFVLSRCPCKEVPPDRLNKVEQAKQPNAHSPPMWRGRCPSQLSRTFESATPVAVTSCQACRRTKKRHLAHLCMNSFGFGCSAECSSVSTVD